MSLSRTHWKEHIDDVVRSRHYTWLPEGLGGQPVDVAMSCLVTDILHVCRRTGTPWEKVLAEATARFAEEEKELESLVPATVGEC